MAPAGELQRIADVPIYFADPLARHAPALQKTRDAVVPTARMNAATLAALAVTDGAPVRVRQGNGEAVLTARADETVPAGCVRVAAAHVTTAALGEMFGAINVERA
jgi:NADH-quinone oxidoreductase subunit G